MTASTAQMVYSSYKLHNGLILEHIMILCLSVKAI